MPLIDFQHVSKTFARGGGATLLRNHVARLFHRGAREPFYALRNVSFSVERGESVALIGSNGAGKAPCSPWWRASLRRTRELWRSPDASRRCWTSGSAFTPS